MKTTLTVRLDERRARRVADAARRLGKSASDVVREALDMALTDRAIADRCGHVRGRITLNERRSSTWRDQLRQRNWRA